VTKNAKRRLPVFDRRILDLVWLSEKRLAKEDRQVVENYAIARCNRIVEWIGDNNDILIKKVGRYGAFAPHISGRKPYVAVIIHIMTNMCHLLLHWNIFPFI
jgi:hypothetical protein